MTLSLIFNLFLMKTFKQIFLSKDKKKNTLPAFTLVELVIVITILAILSTIWFVYFADYAKNARDGNRLATLTNLEEWLRLYEWTNAVYPLPDNQTWTWTIGGVELIYVWEIGETVSKKIVFNGVPKDPRSSTNYIYGVSVDQGSYQIATVFEWAQTSMFINTLYADDWYSAKVVGNYKWLLTYDKKVYNIPSLIFTNSGTVALTGSDINFVVDKVANLPYLVGSAKTLNTYNTTQILEKVTWNSWITLTWVTKPRDMVEFNATKTVTINR